MTVICSTAPEVHCKPAGSKLWVRLDWTLNLQPGQVITAVAASATPAGLTLTQAQPNPAPYYDRGRLVEIAHGAEVFVENPSMTPGTYIITFSISDSSGQEDFLNVTLEMT